MVTYKEALEQFRQARMELAEAAIALNAKKHLGRTKMYVEKLAGVKYTEEQIRSASYVECRAEQERLERATVHVEILREELAFHKTIINNKEVN